MINSYLLGILGAVLVITIIDLILPNGNISKYIKSIGAIFLVATICSPIVGIMKNGIDLNSIFGNSQYSIDDNYLYNSQLKEAELLSTNLEKLLNDYGYSDVEIIINIEPNNSTIKISTIFADFSKTVLSKNEKHIINYTAVKELIANYTGIEEDKILIDE